MNEQQLYVYVLVRIDLPVADQIVQVGHACLEAGFKFRKAGETIHLVVICVESEIRLCTVIEKISLRGIQSVVFHEPDDEMGFTAACTEPLKALYRREFRDFRLWELSGEVNKT